jgi:predicted enzyme related to lactoylglutathione lyase
MANLNDNLFGWRELLTSDVAGATKFYAGVVGWGTQAWPDPSMNYTTWTVGADAIGGVMELPPEMKAAGVPPHWIGVVNVADCDGTVAKAKELGGTVLNGPIDIPNVGRYATLADPSGAAFSIMQSAQPSPEPHKSRGPGRYSWAELWTSDPGGAWAFYSAIFGWVEKDSMPLPDGSTYRMFARPQDAKQLGGIATKMPEQPVSAWLHYANVDDVDMATNRLRELGGTTVMGPMDIPGGGRIVGAMDPQGAMFALYAHPKG